MIQFSTHTIRLLFITLLAMLLSSCGFSTNTAYFLGSDNQTDSTVESVANDSDLELIEAETATSLSEELTILSKTGSWQTDPSSLNQNQEVAYDFPIVINKQVEAYLDIFQNKQRSTFKRWLARSGKYVPMFKKELREAGLPEDLAYLAMIESGFKQRAFSRAKAVGLWQFMKATGKEYNLRIDRYVDERRHAEKSTKAAVAFLSDLYANFGDWHLAVAGYNAGGGKIRRGLKRYQTDNFWSLATHKYLKLETKRYVPKLIAAIIIAKNPEKYGFTNIAYETPLAYETLRVGPGLSLNAVAIVCDTDSTVIKQLNQELKTGRTPFNKSHYDVQIPINKKELAEANLPKLNSVVRTGYKTHKIRRGDTLSKICKQYNINKTTLLKINNLRSSKLIAGKNLRIPYSSAQYRLVKKGVNGNIVVNDLTMHTIKQGETLSKIADTYNVPVDLIVTWNGLASVHKIRAGQQLALYIIDDNTTVTVTNTPQSLHRNVASVPSDNSSIIVLSEQKKIASSKRKISKHQISWYQVRKGDSLWTIARKFNLSTKQLKSLNKLKSNRIQPGIKLKISNV